MQAPPQVFSVIGWLLVALYLYWLPFYGPPCQALGRGVACGLGLGSWAWQGVPLSLDIRTTACPLELCLPGAELCGQNEGSGHLQHADGRAWPP